MCLSVSWTAAAAPASTLLFIAESSGSAIQLSQSPSFMNYDENWKLVTTFTTLPGAIQIIFVVMDAGKWYPLSKLASSISIISYHTLYGSKSNLMLTPRKYKYVEEKKLHLIFRTLHLIKRSRRRGGIKEQDSLFVLRKSLRINNIFDQIKESTW